MRLRHPIAIVHPARSAFGQLGGILAGYEAHELLAAIFGKLIDDITAPIDEVIVGSVRNSLGNIARVAALEARLPQDIPAMTLDRQCASSMEALATAAAKINAGLANQVLVGGVDSASRCPWFMEKTARPYAFFEPRPFKIRMSSDAAGDPSMGETAEILADLYAITREAMDLFALQSHQRAVAARERGFYTHEIIPLPNSGKAAATDLSHDETVRGDSSLEMLAKLRPAFRRQGRVTAGNASPLTDGAAAALACSAEACTQNNYQPAGWLQGVATVALDPQHMGMGPALAIPKLLAACALQATDIDLFEINEAFAGQVLAVNHQLNIPSEKLNVNGGAVAIGHPFGATGLRLIMTLLNALREHDLQRGVASLCIGGGQGMAVLVERSLMP